MPGEDKYGRRGRKTLGQDIRYILSGCGVVLLIVILTYVVYAILLVRSGWTGR